MKDKKGCIALLISVPLMIIVSAIANGWALTVLWNWFVIPVFENAPTMTIPAAMGVALIVGFLVPSGTKDSDKENIDNIYTLIITQLLRILFRPAFAVFMGWLILAMFW